MAKNAEKPEDEQQPEPTKGELLEEARALNVEGRSNMGKEELAKAVEAATPSRPEVDDVPARVETFSEGDSWAWRTVSANGRVLKEVAFDFDSQDAALEAAYDDSFNRGQRLLFVDRPGDWRPARAW